MSLPRIDHFVENDRVLLAIQNVKVTFLHLYNHSCRPTWVAGVQGGQYNNKTFLRCVWRLFGWWFRHNSELRYLLIVIWRHSNLRTFWLDWLTGSRIRLVIFQIFDLPVFIFHCLLQLRVQLLQSSDFGFETLVLLFQDLLTNMSAYIRSQDFFLTIAAVSIHFETAVHQVIQHSIFALDWSFVAAKK